MSTCDGAGMAQDDGKASSDASSSSSFRSSASPDLERWGTPSAVLGVPPADTVAHAAAAQGSGEAAVRSLATSLSAAPSLYDAAGRAAAKQGSGLQPLGEVNDATLSEATAEPCAGGAREDDAPVPIPEAASAAARSSAVPDEDARRGPASFAQNLGLSIGPSAASVRDAGPTSTLAAAQPDEVRCRLLRAGYTSGDLSASWPCIAMQLASKDVHSC